MKKTILFFVLFLLFLSFLVFFVSVWNNLNIYRSEDSNVSKVVETLKTSQAVQSLYLDYSNENYDSALQDKRVVILFFTSNWCVECLEQDKVNLEVFDDLKDKGLVGLRIHILDSETTTETDALAKKFDIHKENSFVVLNQNGAVHFKHTGNIEKELLKQKIEEVSTNL
ncbi:MAG: thioredoxin family protein [bacterium]|nr:MAG: thioredoxin family protein [bacterium]